MAKCAICEKQLSIAVPLKDYSEGNHISHRINNDVCFTCFLEILERELGVKVIVK